VYGLGTTNEVKHGRPVRRLAWVAPTGKDRYLAVKPVAKYEVGFTGFGVSLMKDDLPSHVIGRGERARGPGGASDMGREASRQSQREGSALSALGLMNDGAIGDCAEGHDRGSPWETKERLAREARFSINHFHVARRER
jgi:hypothetical protein